MRFAATGVLALIVGVCLGNSAFSEELSVNLNAARMSARLARQLQTGGEDLLFVDVRSPSEFARRHVVGAVNIPVADIRKATIPQAGLLVLYCPQTACTQSTDASSVFLQLGYSNVRVLDGGLEAWIRLGYPAEPGTATGRVVKTFPGDLRRVLGSSEVVIIDVRRPEEFAAGHVPGAANLPLEGLSGSLTSMDDKGPCVVYDRLQDRAHQAAIVVAESGREVRELVGGIGAWAKKGYPMAVGSQSELK